MSMSMSNGVSNGVMSNGVMLNCSLSRVKLNPVNRSIK